MPSIQIDWDHICCQKIFYFYSTLISPHVSLFIHANKHTSFPVTGIFLHVILVFPTTPASTEVSAHSVILKQVSVWGNCMLTVLIALRISNRRKSIRRAFRYESNDGAHVKKKVYTLSHQLNCSVHTCDRKPYCLQMVSHIDICKQYGCHIPVSL